MDLGHWAGKRAPTNEAINDYGMAVWIIRAETPGNVSTTRPPLPPKGIRVCVRSCDRCTKCDIMEGNMFVANTAMANVICVGIAVGLLAVAMLLIFARVIKDSGG